MKEELDDLLRLWRPEIVESSTFKRDVWQRIEQSRGAEGRLESLFAWLARPGVASLATALAILGGVLIGSALAGQNGEVAYLRAVNPYAQLVSK